MLTNFKFIVTGENEPTQTIVVTPQDAEDIKIPIPQLVLPTIGEERFHMLYAVLVDKGLASANPTFKS